MASDRISAFRLVSKKWASTAMSGEGARKHGGRWNPPGLLCVYLADSRALAALEILVHLTPLTRSLSWQLIEVSIPSDQIKTVKRKALPTGWDRTEIDRETQEFGRAWLEVQSAPVLRVPSSIIDAEHLYLLNPLHPGARRIREVESLRFTFDERL